MRCFYVLVHGSLHWQADSAVVGEDVASIVGFCCHRYVLASTPEQAADKAFRRVRANLDRQTGWLSRGLASLSLEAEEVGVAPMHKLLIPDDRGHTFY